MTVRKADNPTRSVTRILVLLLASLLCLSLAAYFTRTSKPSPDKALMDSAAAVTRRAFDALYAEKQARGIPVDESDMTRSGVIGRSNLTAITTTDGSLSAKRVSTNPNFAALFVLYLRRAGVHAGDEVGLMFSSSFPALNIACLAACETVGARVCLMNSVGASVYGATDADFTFMDMLDVLCREGILHTSVNCLSFGGEGDVGADFDDEDGVWIEGDRTADEIRQSIRDRADARNIPFLYEPDFTADIAARIDLLRREVPDMKLFISVGGSVCALGRGINAYIETGYRAPSAFGINRPDTWEPCPPSFGLLQYFHSAGIPVVSMLNVEKAALDMHMDAAEQTVYPLGIGDMYTETEIGLWYPICVLADIAAACVFLIPRVRAARAEKRQNGTLCTYLLPLRSGGRRKRGGKSK